jgi:antitoxin (DNA-binding transcriptional repressor) of toxin-antitoxin stability system
MLTSSVHFCTLTFTSREGCGTVKLPITEARRRLPELVRRVRKDPGSTVQITVRDEVVAELRAALPEPEPGAAGRALLEALRKLPRRRGRRIDVAVRAEDHLYGSDGVIR